MVSLDSQTRANSDSDENSTQLDMDDISEKNTAQEEPYTVFSPTKILVILLIASLTGMLSPLTANIYLPALNLLQKDLDTTTELVNLTVTVYMVFQAISPTFWGSLADVWGRRPVYLATLIIYIGANIGLALTNVYWLLLVLRMVQAFGSSSVIAIGAGVVGDIAEPSKRGGYFGVYTAGQLLGPVIGPVIGGAVADRLGWRWIFWILVIVSGVALLSGFFFLPETLRSLVGNGSGYANPTPAQWLRRRRDKSPVSVEPHSTHRFRRIPNFTAPFLYLLQYDVLLALAYNAFHYTAYYCFSITTTKLFSSHYGLSELQIGLCFLCPGVGCVAGSLLEGRIMNHNFRVVAKKRGFPLDKAVVGGKVALEFPIFRARLRTMWINAAVAQVICLIYGWLMMVRAPLAVALVLQFLVGYGTTAVMTTFQTILIDLYPGKGASITASNNLCRCILGAVFTFCMEPGIQSVGYGWMFTIVGIILVLSNAFVPLLIHYGSRWRVERAEKEGWYKKEDTHFS